MFGCENLTQVATLYFVVLKGREGNDTVIWKMVPTLYRIIISIFFNRNRVNTTCRNPL